MITCVRWLVLGLLVSTVLFPGACPPSVADPVAPVSFQSITYAGLCDFVRAQQGKVVVVDVWADFCIPCKMGFPHLVEMHQKYAKQGLVCVSVSVDDPEDTEAIARAHQFVAKQKATFANFHLKEPVDVWQNRFDTNGPPVIFVFDRQGKRAGRYGGSTQIPFSYDQIENQVTGLLERKP